MKKSLYTFAVILMVFAVSHVSAKIKCSNQCSKSQASAAACQVVDKTSSACPYGTGDCTKCPYMGKSKASQSHMKGASFKSSVVKNGAKVSKSSQSLAANAKPASLKSDETIKAETPKRFKQ
jgi:hypothetical protein